MQAWQVYDRVTMIGFIIFYCFIIIEFTFHLFSDVGALHSKRSTLYTHKKYYNRERQPLLHSNDSLSDYEVHGTDERFNVDGTYQKLKYVRL